MGTERLLRERVRPIEDEVEAAFFAEAARQCRLANESNFTDPAAAFADHLADELLREVDEEEAQP